MLTVEMTPGVHWIGVNDRTTDLFEGMWPIHREGVSYNSFAIKDEKNVLVDLAKAFKTGEYLDRINEVFPVEELDYIVINHTEPDHTGALPVLCRLAPQAQILCSAKGKDMLIGFYHLDESRIRVVSDGEQLNIGSRTLSFYMTPFLHWPDTMMTFDDRDGILFSCDAFGGYGALSGAIYDDNCEDLEYYREEALRYYANIVSLFSPMVLKGIEKLEKAQLPIKIIAPSHGIIWRKNPLEIIELYRKWAFYFKGEAEMGVTLLYASMYGNTEKYMNAVAQGVSSEEVPVKIFDAARMHSSYVLPSIMRYKGVVLGVPTYESGMFPPTAHQLDIIERKGLRNRFAGIFGSYLWSGGARKEFARFSEKLKWEVVEDDEFRGGSTSEQIDAAFRFGARYAKLLKER